jgi:hypothetical protein
MGMDDDFVMQAYYDYLFYVSGSLYSFRSKAAIVSLVEWVKSARASRSQ